MPHFTAAMIRNAVIVFAMLRGLGEFASLQRWRVREWMAR
jgi:hypothetical protein